ncbi:hypothetical protein [Streptomyces sp. NPDC060031]|uniref:hypothetical protein n=1 Tax=Streptomyces sp. NPDC060031 TaxID=3347043 RepID=UPI003677B3F2
MSATARPRVARVYTSARRHPWVLGKLGDWTIWFGPYTPAQLVVLGGGAFALIKTYALWSWAGPVPVLLWVGGVWAVRGAQIAGQNPFTALLGVLTLLLRHPAGRISGRVARDRRPSYLRGRFIVEAAPEVAPGLRAVVVETVSARHRAPVGSGLSRLVADAAGAEGRAA